MLRSEVFRGYRALPVAVTAGLAVLTAVVQTVWQRPADLQQFLLSWIAYAVLCCVVCGTDVILRFALGGRRRRREAMLAVLQFVPAVVVGVVATTALFGGAAAVLLPGLWTLVFGLGIFASLPYLPRSLTWVAAFYLLAGAALLWTAAAPAVPAPWTLGFTFGFGQAATAWLLRTNLES